MSYMIDWLYIYLYIYFHLTAFIHSYIQLCMHLFLAYIFTSYCYHACLPCIS